MKTQNLVLHTSIGYWLWLAGTVVMAFGSAWAVRVQRLGLMPT